MKRIAYLVSLVMAIGMTGCASRQAQGTAGDGAMARIGIVNHTGNDIYWASVNGANGGDMSAWGAGNAGVCCTLIPTAWYPSMQVEIRWNMPIGKKDVIKKKIVEVEKYEETGDVYIHIFPDDEVRVVVSPDGPRAPRHPIPHAGKPKDAI